MEEEKQTYDSAKFVEIPNNAEIKRVSEWHIENEDGVKFRGQSVRYEVEPDTDIQNLDLTDYYNVINKKKIRPYKQKPNSADLCRVFLYTDPQIGKVDSRNGIETGTKDYIERMRKIRLEIEQDFVNRPVEHSVMADGGDGIESVNQQKSQLFTSDISEPKAVEIYAIETHKLIELFRKNVVGDVSHMATPSNHNRWGGARNQLGRIGDDWGMTNQNIVKLSTDAAGWDITYIAPNSLWDDITYLNVMGHEIALYHGDQARSGVAGMANYVKSKTATGDFNNTELLLSGHYHHLLFTEMGTTVNGVNRMWLQGPALDAGSSWYARKGGFESPAGLVSIDISRTEGVLRSSLHWFDGSTIKD